jgi:hypothetical protein
MTITPTHQDPSHIGGSSRVCHRTADYAPRSILPPPNLAMVPAVAQALNPGTDHRTDTTRHTTPGRPTTLRQNDPIRAP